MERNGHLCLEMEVRERLLEMTAATIDSLFRPVRARATQDLRRLNTALRKSINISTFKHWKNSPPSYFEMDILAHSGKI